MKLNGKVVVAVAMMIGSMGAVGCSASTPDTSAVAPEESVANAPVENDTAGASTTSTAAASATNAFGFQRSAVRFHYYAPHAPPAMRYEVQGRAPSGRHFWAPGYWRWNGREHVWMGGRWELRRDGYEYNSPRWFVRGSRWEYVPGHWVRRF